MIALYYGEDTLSLSQELKQLKAQFSFVEEMEIGGLSDSELVSRITEILRGQGLFASKKMVVLKNFLTEIHKFPKAEEFLLQYLKKDDPDVTVVFAQSEGIDKRLKFFKALQKQAQVREFAVPRGTALEKWVTDYLSARGFSIASDALRELGTLLGAHNEDEQLYDMWQVQAELEKLMLLKDSEKTITIADVRQVVRANVSENVFLLTNLFAEGKAGEASLLLEKMVTQNAAAEMKAESLKIIGGLASQIRSLLLVKSLEAKSHVAIAKTLGWKEGRVYINAKLAKKFTAPKLLGLLGDLRALDLRLKTSEEPPKLLLSLFFQKAKVR